MIEDHPRLSLEVGRGTEFRVGLRGALESLRDELGVLIGALSRTQTSQFEAREGLELRLWVPSRPGGLTIDDPGTRARRLAAGRRRRSLNIVASI